MTTDAMSAQYIGGGSHRLLTQVSLVPASQGWCNVRVHEFKYKKKQITEFLRVLNKTRAILITNKINLNKIHTQSL